MGTTNFDAVAVGGVQLNPNHYDVVRFFVAGNQSVGTKKGGALIPFAGTIVDVRAYADTAPATTALIADVNLNGTTIFTTQANRPTIAAGANASSTTLPDVVAVAQGDRLTFDTDQIGTGTVGADFYLAVTIKRQHAA